MSIKNKIKKLTKEDLRTLGNISQGLDTIDDLSCYESLEKQGLIVKVGETRTPTSSVGLLVVSNWEMPISVHIEWCQLCDRDPDFNALFDE